MSRQTEGGDTFQAGIGSHISHFWASESTADAPAANSNLPTGTLGCASVGASTGEVYIWNGDDWKATGSIMKSFYGATT